MDRVRTGLTGLGVVFLFTLAASLAFGPSDDAPASAAQEKAPGEPLAQLGVAPSSENADKGPMGDRSGNDNAGKSGRAEAPRPATVAPAAPDSPVGDSPVRGPGEPLLGPGGDRPVAV
jgi:hypothetical protein